MAEKSIVLEKKGKVNNLKVAAGDKPFEFDVTFTLEWTGVEDG